jgi:hypothetical protein
VNNFQKAQRIIEAGLSVAARGHSQVEDIRLYSGYAEPGYTDPKSGVIALGNWNSVSEYRAGKFVTVDDTPARVASLLEKLGVELEWEDEWAACQECGRISRISPDSYRWQRSGVEDEGGTVCGECLAGDPADYLAGLEGNPDRCNTIAAIDPADHGYVLVRDGFEHGFHPGQDASPRLIAEALERYLTRFLFNLDGTGQFDLSFSVYVHESEEHLLPFALESLASERTDGPSVSEGLRAALEDASAKMASLPDGEGVKYARCDPTTGTARVRVVSPEEFVQGIRD